MRLAVRSRVGKVLFEELDWVQGSYTYGPNDAHWIERDLRDFGDASLADECFQVAEWIATHLAFAGLKRSARAWMLRAEAARGAMGAA